MIGVVFDLATGEGTAYRTVRSDMRGRYTRTFVQTLGEVTIPNADTGPGTCKSGLHVASAATAWTYFGIDPTARLIRCRFRREDVCDCDGQKARLRRAICDEIPWPWAPSARP
jgi:hypothetical protein